MTIGSLVMNECPFSASQVIPWLVYRKEQALIASGGSSNGMSFLTGLNKVYISRIICWVVKRELFNCAMPQKVTHRANPD